MKWILLVTWVTSAQPPSSYQVDFDARDKCLQAREAVLADYARLYPCQAQPGVHYCATGPANPPRVSAVCISR